MFQKKKFKHYDEECYMNDYQEYRSYGSYLSRVLAIILAFLVLVLAVWFVVRLARSDSDTATTNVDDTTVVDSTTNAQDDAQSAVTGGLDSLEIEAVESSDESDSTAASLPDETEESGQVLATNTEATLPNTGPESLLGLLFVPIAAFMATKFVQSRRLLGSSYNV